MGLNDMHQIKILDATLSDCSNTYIYSMDTYEKVKLAMQLEKLGVDIIEVGFAANSENEYQTIKCISKVITNSTVCSLASLNKHDVDVAYDALQDANNKRINLFINTSDIYRQALRIDNNVMLNQAANIVAYAKDKFSDIEFTLEDATRTDLKFACQIIETAINSGANTINISDTLGYIMPTEFTEYINYIKNNVKNIDQANLSVHCHNDLGNAVSNSLVAAKLGVNQLECTINGIGKRAGNAALEEIIATLDVRKDYFNCYTNIVLKEIYPTSQMISQIIEMPISYNKAVVGMNTFKNKAELLGNHSMNSLVDSARYGFTEQNLVLDKSLSKNDIIQLINNVGIDISNINLDLVMDKINQLEGIYLTLYNLRHVIEESILKPKIKKRINKV